MTTRATEFSAKEFNDYCRIIFKDKDSGLTRKIYITGETFGLSAKGEMKLTAKEFWEGNDEDDDKNRNVKFSVNVKSASVISEEIATNKKLTKSTIDIVRGVMTAAKAIDQGIQDNNSNDQLSIIVHCKSGLERSPAAVAYYLIRYQNLPAAETTEAVMSAVNERADREKKSATNGQKLYKKWLKTLSDTPSEAETAANKNLSDYVQKIGASYITTKKPVNSDEKKKGLSKQNENNDELFSDAEDASDTEGKTKHIDVAAATFSQPTRTGTVSSTSEAVEENKSKSSTTTRQTRSQANATTDSSSSISNASTARQSSIHTTHAAPPTTSHVSRAATRTLTTSEPIGPDPTTLAAASTREAVAKDDDSDQLIAKATKKNKSLTTTRQTRSQTSRSSSLQPLNDEDKDKQKEFITEGKKKKEKIITQKKSDAQPQNESASKKGGPS